MNQEKFEKVYQNLLTPKQKQCLGLFLAGNSDDDIAFQLGATHRTSTTHHLKNVAIKFELLSQFQSDFRCKIIELFIKYKPELVSVKALKKYGYISPKIAFPQGAEPLNSSFYQPRHNLEVTCYRTIKIPGSLIRIKGARKMGKTSLVKRILAQAKKNKDCTIYLNFSLIDREKFSQANNFFRSFYAYIINQIMETPTLQAWNDDLPNTINCTSQMKKVLKQLPTGLVLALDEIDKLFEYPEIYQNFFPMLRTWNENANESEIWEKLRIVVAHSTEDYGRLDINQSPFNIGLPVTLEDFHEEEVQKLAVRHGLNTKVVLPIMSIVGGHPYLIRLAFYYLATQNINLNDLLKSALTDNGIYYQHLSYYLDIFQTNPELGLLFQTIVRGQETVKKNLKNKIRLHQLEALGLIKIDGSLIMPRCRLYCEYFKHCFN